MPLVGRRRSAFLRLPCTARKLPGRGQRKLKVQDIAGKAEGDARGVWRLRKCTFGVRVWIEAEASSWLS